MNRNYRVEAPLIRAAFAAAAVACTIGLGSFIDQLATGYAEAGVQDKAPATVQLARR